MPPTEIPCTEILCINDLLKMPMMHLPIRCTAVQLQHGVVLISPTSNIEQHKTEIDRLGQVTDIVAPNLLHHLYIPRAKRLFPQARLWGTKGFADKRRDVQWDGILTDKSWPYKKELDFVELHGAPKVNETVFIHAPSKTAIVADLCMNLNATDWKSRMILSLFGTCNRFAVSRLFAMMIKDRNAFKASTNVLMKQDFDRLIMAHGAIINHQAKEKLRQALMERGLI